MVASNPSRPASYPPALALISGKGGVGRSSLALNLALSIGALEQRVLLVDADPNPGHLALLAGYELPESFLPLGITQTLALSESVDLLQFHAATEDTRCQPLHIDGEALSAFESRYDIIIADTGSGIAASAQAAARAADASWVVITPELTAVADGYATAKSLLCFEPATRLGCLVNAAEDEEEAEDLHHGFADLLDRFLEAKIDNRGYIPFDRTVRDAAKSQSPFCLAKPSTQAALAVAALASELTERHPIVTLPRHRAYLEGIADFVSASPDGSLAMRQAQEPSLIV
ncbi:MAG: AAA family ATPase [Gemmatimonadetes bacterium]|nr:AAA family ATPase [Gemmatimonadota bacterium]MBT5586574.1 AAA family ATPase [Gemmatimonadota bacterium]MBT5964410.1 AAA family ATPase [Gemmatimonadota bacterium]MBT6626559.1 AAA family ATPase [Gemmatimonadota bacterium]MBT7456757.1 AAA family ATPase [Gemmatimonadota bacterium]